MMKSSTLVFLALSLLLVACGPSAEDRNKAAAARVFTEMFTEGKLELAAELYSPDFVNHGISSSIGLEEDQAAARGWRDAFPDLQMKVEKLIAEGDEVAVMWIGSGTNTGTGNGLPATGKAMQLRGITIWRFVDGKITEEWSAFDQYTLLLKLGLLPAE